METLASHTAAYWDSVMKVAAGSYDNLWAGLDFFLGFEADTWQLSWVSLSVSSTKLGINIEI